MSPASAERVVDALIDAHLVAPTARDESVSVVVGALASATTSTSPEPAPGARRGGMSQLVEVVAYLGGALVLAAGALFLVEEWGQLGFGARTTLLAVVTGVLLVAGLVAVRVPAGGPAPDEQVNDVRRRLAGALFTAAGLAAAFLVGHVLDHLTNPDFSGVYWPAVAGAAVGTVVAGVGYRWAPSVVGVVGLMAGVVTAASNLASGTHIGSEGDTAGVAFVVTGVLWLVVTERHVFREVTIARALGVALTLVGAQVPAIDGTHAWLGYLLTLGVVVAGIALYLGTGSWPYLAAAVIGVTLVVPEAVSDWTGGSLGVVGGVLLAGVTLLVASFAGYRLRAEKQD